MMGFLAAAVLLLGCAMAAELPAERQFANSIGLRFARIEPGSFLMGFEGEPLPPDLAGRPHRREGDFDERPAHRVTLSRAFYLGVFEVTNAQYEQFDPGHRQLRGKLGFSKNDDEAVVFVSWGDAVRFCEWLSKKEGLPYRLPTEAEWEYACRAGTATRFHTGDSLPKVSDLREGKPASPAYPPEGVKPSGGKGEFRRNARQTWFPDPAHPSKDDVVALTVGQTPPNAWGLCDMHGNVEEWCSDWYGAYEAGDQADPVGRADGDFRVTRGGSHSTELFYLRSANRSGALPDERSWLIGFRVALGEMPSGKPLPAPTPPLNQQNVKQGVPPDLARGPDPDKPYFKGPRQYVKIPPGSSGPMFSAHNHDPAIAECPNGDLLAIWYTCVDEPGRELAILASRLRHGQEEWESASPFWDTPDRNDHAPALWRDEQGTLCHFNGLSAAATWGNLATILRTSEDSGATWSKARLIVPEHGIRHMPVQSVFRTAEGFIVLPCDAVTGGNGGTAIHVSRDNGATWEDAGGKTAGIHAGVVQLKDGRLMALGRGDSIDGKMPKSVSSDMGKTWAYSASPFPPIGGGQRLVLRRLKEGPLFIASFAPQTTLKDAAGGERTGSGLYAALSFDEGETWPIRRLVTDDGPGRPVETTDGRLFTMDASHAEPRGYLAVCQAANGLVHVISSRQHDAFNLKWVTTPSPTVEKR